VIVTQIPMDIGHFRYWSFDQDRRCAAEAWQCKASEARQEGALVGERCRPPPNWVECECISPLLLCL